MAETPTTPDQGDERRAEAYMAAHDAFNSAVPAGLRGHSEWCDRFDAARAAFDAAQPGAQEAIAWSLRFDDDPRLNLSTVFDTEDEAKNYAARCGSATPVPLFAAPHPSQGARQLRERMDLYARSQITWGELRKDIEAALAAPPQPVTRITWDEEGRRLVNGQLAPEHQPVEPGDERRAFDLYWLARQRQRGFGAALTDAEMLSHPEDRADEFLAWQAARALPAAGVSIEEYRRVVSRCIELGEKIAALSAQPVAQEARDPIDDPEIVAIRTALDWISTGKNATGKELADRAYLALGRVRSMLAAPPSQGAEIDEGREEFERIANAPLKRDRVYTDQYEDSRTNELWHVWKLSRYRLAAPHPPVSAEAGKGVESIGYFHCNGEFHAVMPADWEPSESVAVSGEVSEDTKRLDWLESKTVNVRTPMRYGSTNLFWAGPSDDDGLPVKSDLRERIDAVLALAASGGKRNA